MFTIESSKLQKIYFINLTGFQNLLGFSLSGKPFFGSQIAVGGVLLAHTYPTAQM